MGPLEDGLPDVLAQMVRGLVGSGAFSVVTDRRGGMGGRELVLRETAQSVPLAEVEVLGELGEWSVGLRFEGMGSFYLPLAWQGLLDRGELGFGSLADQVRIVEERRVEAGAAFLTLPDVEDRLRRLSDTRPPG